MNKKGFTVVELIVSFSLTIVIFVFLMQIIMNLDNLYKSSGIKTELLNKQSLISSQINNKLNKKTISSLSSCGNYCLQFNYFDGTNDILKINYSNNTLEFGNFRTMLPEDSYFKDVQIDIVYGATIQTDVNNAMLNISIPIYNDDLNDNYGVNIVYQFNSDYTNISYVDFAGKGQYIVLSGDTEQTFNTQTAYIEQGYTIYDKDGNVITGNVEIDNPLTTVPYKAGKYKIKYTLKDDSGNILSQTTRSITVKPSTYNITNLVTNGSFESGNNINPNEVVAGTVELATENSYEGSYSIKLVPTNLYGEMYAHMPERYSFEPSHKYYYSLYYISSSPVNLYFLSEFWYNNGVLSVFLDGPSPTWKRSSLYVYEPSYSATDDMLLRFDNDNDISQDTIEIAYYDAIMLIDLTETFGEGNEPSKEWCDENIDWFEGTTKINY